MADDPIVTQEDILKMLDAFLQKRGGEWWDNFFSDHERDCPFFIEKPDENLVAYFNTGRLKAGRVLDLGCGNGRNSVFMALQGCQVDAVDFSHEAIEWAKNLMKKNSVEINYNCISIFDLKIKQHDYDIVYDCGCFHHLPPHRRNTYLELVKNALKPSGMFGLACFTPEGGSGFSDIEVYEKRRLGGGLGYTDQQLHYIFSRFFNILECRKMRQMTEKDAYFGRDFLWTMLMQPN
jgi:cyclopropane fatty-acyl-phospholipid synthase-like methyltransferase